MLLSSPADAGRTRPILLAWIAVLAVALPGAGRAMSVIAPTFDQLVGSATLVVRGTVTDVHCVTFNSPQGEGIKTLVTLHVERTLKGTPTGDVTLSFLGGKVGAHTMTVVGMPTFHVGQREIVFVGDNGRAICPLIAAGYGRYHVRHDAATGQDYVTRDNGRPLHSTSEIVQSLDTAQPPATASGAPLTPEAFESRIIAAVRGSQSNLQP